MNVTMLDEPIEVIVLDDVKAVGMTHEEAIKQSVGAVIKAMTLPDFAPGYGYMLGLEWQGHHVFIAVHHAETYIAWLSLDNNKIEKAIRERMGSCWREGRREVKDGQHRLNPLTNEENGK